MNSMFAFLGLGGTELMVIMGAVLLLFGPKKLPELARGLGKGIREFKKASSEVTEELERAVEEPPAPPTKFPTEGSPHSDYGVPHTPQALPESRDCGIAGHEHTVPHTENPSPTPK